MKSQDEYFLDIGEQHRLISSCCVTDSFAIEFWYRSCSRRNWFWRFHFVRLFWYLLKYSLIYTKAQNKKVSHQVFTWVSDKFNWFATSPRSATDRYFWHRNFLSRKASCEWVNAVLRRRFRLEAPLLLSNDEKAGVSCCVRCIFE